MPGDVVAVEPGDQLVADGEVVASRGMTLDESMLTGEADGVRKEPGDRALSGSFCISGSGRYVVDAVREESYAGKLAGEARAFRHPPSPLQDEVNRVIVACTYVMVPLAALLLLTFKLRSADLIEAAQTATAGLVTLIPEGLVLLMSVTFAVAAVRLARPQDARPADERDREPRLGRHDLRRQDRDADRRRAAPARGRGRRRGRPEAARTRRWARFAASAGDRNRTLEAIAERFPGKAGAGQRRGPLLLGVEVERPADRRRRATCWARRTCSSEAGALSPAAAASRRELEQETASGPAGRRLRRVRPRRCPPTPPARRRRRG